MVRKGVTITTVLVVVVAAVVVAVVFITNLKGPQLPYCSVNASGSGENSTTSGSSSPHYTFSAEQAGNAATIAAVGMKLGLPAHAVTIALATAWQESKLVNLTSGDRDSAGLFQQRPSQGWGTYDQVTDPVHAATAFYQHLTTESGWQDMPVTQAAQEVQHSATPDAYAQWEDESRAMASALTGETQAQLSCHNLSVAPSKQDIGTVAQDEWGTSAVSGAHDPAQGWALGSWLVAKATQLGVDSVTVGDHTWTAETGDWASTGGASATGTVSLQTVKITPTS
ncbi:MAG TPA: hypothetical protein VGN81_04580 [Pseudonocardiaceae bacterium]|jgi:hypothetical protein